MEPKQAYVGPVWTVPNTVSFIRLTVLLPLSLGLLAAGDYGWSLVTLFFLGTSDALDGFLARKLNQVTALGAELDPLSDRASILLVSVALVIGKMLPWYLFAVVVAVDVCLSLAATLWFHGYPNVPVSLIGKIRTALMMLGLPGLILAAALHNEVLREIALVIVTLGVIAHVIAGYGYMKVMVERHARSKRDHSLSASSASSVSSTSSEGSD